MSHWIAAAPEASGADLAGPAERGVERAFLGAFGVLRAGVVAQTAVAVVSFWLSSELHSASGLMSIAAIVWSVLLFVGLVRRGSFAAAPWWWCAADILSAMLALIVLSFAVPPALHIGTWHGWDYAYGAVVSPTIAAWKMPRGRPIVLAAGLALVYTLAVSLGNQPQSVTISVNAISYVIFAASATVVCRGARRLASVADENRDRAVELATQLEQDRYRFHIHNVTGLLARLARSDTPDEILPSLRTQALEEANRLRNDVLTPPGSHTAEPDSATTLAQVVHASARGFGHLPLDVRTALVRDVQLHRAEALVIQSALVSLLYNVQFHSQATEVVVHADCEGGRWEVSVCDDGVGFDQTQTAFGFGLHHQVLESARGKGMSVEIDSHPGEGTCVFIRGQLNDPC